MIKNLYKVHVAPEVGLVSTHLIVAANEQHLFDYLKVRWPQAINVNYEMLGECEYYVPLAEMVEEAADQPPGSACGLDAYPSV